jgi:A/G-specific adenine glycosylase
MFFTNKLLSWYKIHKRDLPWRCKEVTPYQVLVSEIMLQQTQVDRVIIKYHEFLDLFPSIQSLANASSSQIVHAWSGLGYNRRALMLHKFAQVVIEKYNGVIPSSYEELLKLPGIGPYAAGSIAAFAYNKEVPAIDVNVRRVFMRFFSGEDQGLPMKSMQEKELFFLVKNTIPLGKSSEFHNALMDFASLVCTRKSPVCSSCVMKDNCLFFPKYETNGKDAFFVMDKKEEKGVEENGKHIPNRIFRGRIVEFARKNNGKEISLFDFGALIKKDYSDTDEKWLIVIGEKLEKDKLIKFKIKDKKIKIKLK